MSFMGKSRVNLLPVFGWAPEFMDEYDKDFVNHTKKIVKIASKRYNTEMC